MNLSKNQIIAMGAYWLNCFVFRSAFSRRYSVVLKIRHQWQFRNYRLWEGNRR